MAALFGWDEKYGKNKNNNMRHFSNCCKILFGYFFTGDYHREGLKAINRRKVLLRKLEDFHIYFDPSLKKPINKFIELRVGGYETDEVLEEIANKELEKLVRAFQDLCSAKLLYEKEQKIKKIKAFVIKNRFDSIDYKNICKELQGYKMWF